MFSDQNGTTRIDTDFEGALRSVIRHGTMSSFIVLTRNGMECHEMNGEPIWNNTDFHHVEPKRTELNKNKENKTRSWKHDTDASLLMNQLLTL